MPDYKGDAKKFIAEVMDDKLWANGVSDENLVKISRLLLHAYSALSSERLRRAEAKATGPARS